MTELAGDIRKAVDPNKDQTLRKDAGKLRLDLVPGAWIEGLARVLQMGAEKYEPWGWAKRPMAHHRMVASRMRHELASDAGERLDPESGLDHRLHAAWNLLADWYYDEVGAKRMGDPESNPLQARAETEVAAKAVKEHVAVLAKGAPPLFMRFEHDGPSSAIGAPPDFGRSSG